MINYSPYVYGKLWKLLWSDQLSLECAGEINSSDGKNCSQDNPEPGQLTNKLNGKLASHVKSSLGFAKRPDGDSVYTWKKSSGMMRPNLNFLLLEILIILRTPSPSGMVLAVGGDWEIVKIQGNPWTKAVLVCKGLETGTEVHLPIDQ